MAPLDAEVRATRKPRKLPARGGAVNLEGTGRDRVVEQCTRTTRARLLSAAQTQTFAEKQYGNKNNTQTLQKPHEMHGRERGLGGKQPRYGNMQGRKLCD